jgi:hypothetical protein
MATVRDDIDDLIATHNQKEVAIPFYYGPRGNLDFSDPFKPVGDQSRLRRVFKVYQQLDEKSAVTP